jgi:hypothetical protein
MIPKSAGGQGLHDATRDPAVVAAWRRRWPTANVGLRCGEAFFVLDVDGPEGWHTLTGLLGRHGALPTTVTACSGGGGWHLFFAMPTGRTIRKQRGHEARPEARRARRRRLRRRPAQRPPERAGLRLRGGTGALVRTARQRAGLVARPALPATGSAPGQGGTRGRGRPGRQVRRSGAAASRGAGRTSAVRPAQLRAERRGIRARPARGGGRAGRAGAGRGARGRRARGGPAQKGGWRVPSPAPSGAAWPSRGRRVMADTSNGLVIDVASWSASGRW